ncbi:ESX secretion-associated protein EspG [Nocardia sp. NPDC058666]|uniref:ESX secretion-associated protein EspG n=1 Tax=Nocardia sp. NPDC058666 TaxID=3346587 RepID=UPI0036608426
MTDNLAPGLRYQFDGLTFELALQANRRDRFPYPLSYRREFAEYRADDERRRGEAGMRLRRIYDEQMHAMFQVLLEPQARVEIEGVHGPQSRVLRVYVGIAGPIAVLAAQQPGPTHAHGGDIVVSTHRSTGIAADITARLPRLHAGGQSRFDGRRGDLDTPVYARHPTQLSPTEHLRRFFHRPRVGGGEITVYPGFQIDARPTDDGRAFCWLDYPDDGRYLLQNHDSENFTVIPGGPEELVRQIGTRIDIVSRPSMTAW